MPILAFQKPDKVIMLEADNSFGKFEFRPLEPGLWPDHRQCIAPNPSFVAWRLRHMLHPYRRSCP